MSKRFSLEASKKSMRILFLILLSLILLIPAISGYATTTRGLSIKALDASGQPQSVKLYNKSYAVIIGIDQYQNLPFDRQLSYAVRDAKGVENVLRKNFKFDKIITLYNKEATKDNILKVLMGDLSRELTEEDALFIFWAGHGNQEKTREGDLGYLIPFDGSMTEVYKNITMAQIRDDISRKIPAKHVFYVMDACYGGLLAQTRAIDKQTKRDYSYLQEITKERVRQVLTAGGKDQQVLDGGPNGHSVFTGRIIEVLENADDFITANELQAVVKEKVFSDARARSHTQTPGYGSLYGVGDFIFIPSLERKVEDTGEKVAALQKEMDRLKVLEVDAAKAKDEQARRKAEIEKIQVEARLRAEQLRQQGLEEQQKKREQELRDDAIQQADLDRKKKENEERLARLKKEVEGKRKEMVGGTSLASLSPQKALDEMQAIDRKIRDIRERFRNELKTGIVQIVNRMNNRYLKLADAKKDEFESEAEFQARLIKEKAALDNEQAQEFTAYQDRIEGEYNQQIAPLIEELKKISGQEFTITAENLILELGTYDGATNTYPVSIKTKKPLEIMLEEGKKIVRKVQVPPPPTPAQPVKKGKKQAVQAPAAWTTKTIIEQEPPKMKYIMLASNANIPIPREEAREFKQHFQNNMLRPELTGNFETPDNFTIAEAKIIDDATTKQYDLFTSRLVVIGNGTVYDTQTKLIWGKKENGNDINWYAARDYIKRLNEQAYLGFRDWRMPTKEELNTLVSNAKSSGFGNDGMTIADFLNREGFSGIQKKSYWTSTCSDSSNAWVIRFNNGSEEESSLNNDTGYGGFRVLPVRGGFVENKPVDVDDNSPQKKKAKGR